MKQAHASRYRDLMALRLKVFCLCRLRYSYLRIFDQYRSAYCDRDGYGGRLSLFFNVLFSKQKHLSLVQGMLF